MKNKILKNLSFALCAALGLFNFILFAFNYIAAYYSYDLGSFGGKQSGSEGVSGYAVMGDCFELGFGGVMSALIQIVIFILGIAMLAYGVYALLKELGIIDLGIIPEQFCSKKFARLALYAYAGLNILLFLFLIIVCLSNSESESEYGFEVEAGIRLGFGIFFTLIVSIGAAVADKMLPGILGVTDGNAPQISYVCSACGKKVKRTVKFCPDCGSKVEERVTEPTASAE